MSGGWIKVYLVPGFFTSVLALKSLKRELEEGVLELLEDEKYSNARYSLEDKPDEYIVYVELPGVNKQDIEVYVNAHTLMVRASTPKDFPLGKRRYRLKLKLPSEVRPDNARAKYENGILTVKLPKKYAAKKIEIE